MAICISLCSLSTTLFWTNQPQSVYIADHIRPFLQVTELLKGRNGLDFRFSRLPSIFPDYFSTLISYPFFRESPLTWMQASCFLNLSFIALSGSLLISRLSNSRLWTTLLTTGSITLIVSTIFPWHQSALGLATMPIHHGGNFTVTMLSWVYLVKLLDQGLLRNRFVFIFIFCTFASVNNLFYIVTFIVPASSILILLFFLKSKLPTALSHSGTLLGGAVTGYLLHSALPLECKNRAKVDLPLLMKTLKYYLGGENILLLLSAFGFFTFLVTLLTCQKRFQGNPYLTNRVLVLAGVGIGGFLTILASSLVSDHQLSSMKYLSVPIILSPYLLSGSLLILLKERIFMNKVNSSAIAFVTIGLVALAIQNEGLKADRVIKYYAQTSNLHLTTKEAYVVDTSMDPVSIEFRNSYRFRMIPAADDGNPWLWHYSKPNIRSAISEQYKLVGFISPKPLTQKRQYEIERKYGRMTMKTGSESRLITYEFTEPRRAYQYLQTIADPDTYIRCNGYR